jgi:hypothetical protein
MESSGFDVQIYSEYNGPLSPIGHAKSSMQPQQVGTHSIHVMLGMPAGPHQQHHQHHHQQSHHQLHHNHSTTIDLCAPHQHQRLPEVHNLLPGGSPKMDHYKAMEYNNKLDYNGKIDSSSYSPNGNSCQNKIEYVNGGKLEAYSTNMKMDYNKSLDYVSAQQQQQASGITTITSNGKIDYSPSNTTTTTSSATTTTGGIGITKIDYSNKSDYDHMNNMFQHPQSIDSTSLNGINSKQRNKSIDDMNNGGGVGGGNNGGCDTSSTTLTGIGSDASSTTNNTKKNDNNNKKKTDSNGVKKKKTR